MTGDEVVIIRHSNGDQAETLCLPMVSRASRVTKAMGAGASGRGRGTGSSGHEGGVAALPSGWRGWEEKF